MRVPRRPTPTVLQLEAVECGAAALKIVLGWHGRVVPLAELRHACGVSRDGSRASNVVSAAAHYGLVGRGVRVEVDQLGGLATPWIAFWNFNHFLVVEGLDSTRDVVWLNDPATGHRSVTMAELRAAFTGVALLFEPGPAFVRGGAEPGYLVALRDRLSGSAPALALAVGAGLAAWIPGLVLTALTQLWVDEVVLGGRGDYVFAVLGGLGAALLANGVLRVVQAEVLRRLRARLAVTASARYLHRLLDLPLAFHRQRYAGELADRAQLHDRIAEGLGTRSAVALTELVTLLLYAVAMFAWNPSLAAVGVAFGGLTGGWVLRAGGRRSEANLKRSQDAGKAGAALVAAIQGIEGIKAGGLEPEAFARWAGHDAAASAALGEMADADRTLATVALVSSGIATAVVLALGALQVMDGALGVGALLAFQVLLVSFFRLVRSLADFVVVLQELEGDVLRVDDVLRTVPERPEPADALRDHIDGGLTLRGLRFGYSRAAPPQLDGFDLDVRAGQWVALVGASGSGKSTVGRLICGLDEAWSGEILFDGRPRSGFSRHALAHGVALVDQETTLFAGSIRENLSLWDPGVPDRALRRACADAELEELLASVPGGLDGHILDGGADLSGGQRQRLEIARSLVHDPKVLVLDEATSALDGETERLVVENLRRRRCTCVVIAHRLATVRDCDEIVVLHRGAVVERGTHEVLLAIAGGRYRTLVERERA